MEAHWEIPEDIEASLERELEKQAAQAVTGIPPLVKAVQPKKEEKPKEAAPLKLKEEKTSPSFVLVRMQDTRPRHLDGGRTVLRPSLPFDENTRLASCFLDLYIGARYAPSPSRAGCVCHATVLAGTVNLMAEGQTLQLLERDALRFAADQPYFFENMSNSTGRLLLEYQYLKGF